MKMSAPPTRIIAQAIGRGRFAIISPIRSFMSATLQAVKVIPLALLLSTPAWAASVPGSQCASVRANAQTTGVTVTHGLTLANGDVLYAFLGQGDDLPDPPTADGWASSSGGTWIQRANAQTGLGNDRAAGVLRRVVTDAGSEPASYTFTRLENNATDNLIVCVVQVRGGDTTTPEDATTVIDETVTDDFTPDHPAITTNTDNALVLIAHLGVGITFVYDSAVAGAPAGYTLVDSGFYDDDANFSELFLAVAVLADAGAAGSKDPGSWTHTGGDAADDGVVMSVAVKPAAGGGGTLFFRRRVQ